MGLSDFIIEMLEKEKKAELGPQVADDLRPLYEQMRQRRLHTLGFLGAGADPSRLVEKQGDPLIEAYRKIIAARQPVERTPEEEMQELEKGGTSPGERNRMIDILRKRL